VRWILRAVRGGWVPRLPAPEPWQGWYAAIADLIPTLPPSAFANWQLARLPAELIETTMVEGNSPTIRSPLTMRATEPMWTIRAAMNKGMPRAFLVDCQDSRSAGGLTIRQATDPAYTVSASMEPRRPARAWLDTGRVVKLTPRALARFQTVPDWYVLPDAAAPACKIVGNGVAVLLAQRLAEGLIA
jgi:DNA (cytosine-5)-methyltransferase 1